MMETRWVLRRWRAVKVGRRWCSCWWSMDPSPIAQHAVVIFINTKGSALTIVSMDHRWHLHHRCRLWTNSIAQSTIFLLPNEVLDSCGDSSFNAPTKKDLHYAQTFISNGHLAPPDPLRRHHHQTSTLKLRGQVMQESTAWQAGKDKAKP